MRTIGARMLMVILLLSPLTVRAGEPYADARLLMTAHADVMESYITGLEKAGTAAECAAVIDAFTDGMADLIPRLEAFQEDYPQLALGQVPDEAPAAVDAAARRLEALAARMPAATMNMMKFIEDAQVQAAMERMSTVMEKLPE